jgi:hypothetical protein
MRAMGVGTEASPPLLGSPETLLREGGPPAILGAARLAAEDLAQHADLHDRAGQLRTYGGFSFQPYWELIVAEQPDLLD